jgi:hypothetical protein
MGLRSLNQLVKGKPLITLLKALPTLQWLDLSNNQIDQFPTTPLKELTYLDIQNNPVKMPQAAEQLSRMCPKLKHLKMSLFTEQDVKCVLDALHSLEMLNGVEVQRELETLVSYEAPLHRNVPLCRQKQSSFEELEKVV